MSDADPTAVCNQALDAALVDFTLGDIGEGTRAAQVCLRAYGECLRQLLRCAPWDFARREAPLLLLADATGQTANVGTKVPSGFVYSYAYPDNCARIRYIPARRFGTPGAPEDNSSLPPVPLTAAPTSTLVVGHRPIPTRYLITNDPNFPPVAGQNYWDVQGVSPTGRVTVLSNVQNAHAVYTYLALYPSVWDHLFRAAMVAYLASEICGPLTKDKRFAMQVRAQQAGIAKQKIMEARVADGNEMVAFADIYPDWMRARQSGQWGYGYAGWGAWGADYGCWGGGWNGSISLGGSAY